MGGRGRRVLAVAGLAAGLTLFLALTGPLVDEEVDAVVRRTGGVCLELERWTLLGWTTVGQTHSVVDVRRSRWRRPVSDPPCATVPEREYLVRVFAEPPGIYRLCGLADDNGCIQFRRVAP
ncbi:MAG TPA: hypothetical protein VMM14_04205 [Acidimicrobiia bacterium]|nr:hypothetical protein [Acidimicrobiia bacterium]